MTTEDQDVLVGRLMRQLREAEHTLAALRTDAAEKALKLGAIAHHLGAYPEYLIQNDESADPRFREQPQMRRWTEADVLSSQSIQSLTAEIRAAILRVVELSRQLKAMGFDVRA